MTAVYWGDVVGLTAPSPTQAEPSKEGLRERCGRPGTVHLCGRTASQHQLSPAQRCLNPRASAVAYVPITTRRHLSISTSALTLF